MKKWGTLLALGGVALAAYMVTAGRRGANQLMHPAPKQKRESLADYGLLGEEVALRTEDGLTLAAWYVPAARAGAPAIALFHGHSATRSQLLPYARFLHPEFACLLVDFRASGDSEGDHATMGCLERYDVKAAIDWLSARSGGRPVGVWAMSAGAAAVLRVAPDDPRIAGLVTDCAFDRLANVIATRATVQRYPLPRLVAKATVIEVARRLGRPLVPPDPVDLIGRLAPRPVLIIHGTEDGTSEVANAHRLFQAAGAPRELLIVPGAAHTEAWRTDPATYETRVLTFFRQALASTIEK